MIKDAMIRARIQSSLKKEVDLIFHELGLSATEAINLFYHQVKLHRGIPFSLRTPNKTTEITFRETDKNINIVNCESEEDMFNKLGI